MALFKKNQTSTPSKPTISRVSKMQTSELYAWADTLLMQLGASFDRHRYHDEPGEEVSSYLDAFDMVWTELRLRGD